MGLLFWWRAVSRKGLLYSFAHILLLWRFTLLFFEEIFVHWKYWFCTANNTSIFAITVYFKNFSIEMFTLASYLLLLISIKELLKDLCNIKGDLSNNYKTIPTVYGENRAKRLISLLVVFCFGVFLLLYFFFSLQSMVYYFLASLCFLVFFTVLLWVSSKPKQLVLLLFGIKALIVLGIICLPLLKIPI